MSVRLINGDCREVLRTLPDASVQCCVTSPPYFGLRSYLDSDDTDKCLEIGAERMPDEYVATLVCVFREVWRVLRDDGTLWLNLGDSMRNKQVQFIPHRVAMALQNEGWICRSSIVWHKPSALPESCKDRPTCSYEMVFLLAKRLTYFYDIDAIRTPHSMMTTDTSQRRRMISDSKFSSARDKRPVHTGTHGGTGEWMLGINPSGANAKNVWTIATESYSGQHYATFPPELPERCIKAGTSEAGACPHCGSPWARVVEKGEPDREHQIACGGSANDGGYNGTALKDYAAAGVQNASDVKRRILEGMRTKRTTGWRQTCSCPEHAPSPCVVLDPFAGSGTTGMVADRLGRDAVLIELKQDGLAQNRITQDCPLFAQVVA